MNISICLVAAFFFCAGCAHFIWLDTFISIVPPYLPWHRELVMLSGTIEIVCAVFFLTGRFRRWAALVLIALCIAVFPANLHMAMNPQLFNTIPVELLYARLPLQLAIIFFISYAATLQTR